MVSSGTAGSALSKKAVIRSYAWDISGHQLYVESGSSVRYEVIDSEVTALVTGTPLVGTHTPNGPVFRGPHTCLLRERL
jgi:hypothetical protein